jgi:predicted aminopeptidase
VVYVQDDTPFNESFATAVERLGVARWLAAHGSDKTRADYAALERQRREFRELAQDTRRVLTDIYESKTASALTQQGQLAMKKIAFEKFRARYAELRSSWAVPAGSLAGYDRWVAQANNASFGAQAAYDDLVPGFEALFTRSGSWPAFYDEVRQLAQLPKDTRLKALTLR